MFQNAFKKLLNIKSTPQYQSGSYGGNTRGSISSPVNQQIRSTPKVQQPKSPYAQSVPMSSPKPSTTPSSSAYAPMSSTPKPTGPTYQAPRSIPPQQPSAPSTNKGVQQYDRPIGPQMQQSNSQGQSAQTMDDMWSQQQAAAQNIAARKNALIDQQYADQEAYAKRQYDTLASDTEADINTAQQRFDQQRANAYADIQAQRGLTDKQKQDMMTRYDSEQLRLAQDRRQRMGQREKQYAALGTLDSYGTGSFQQANTNDENDYTRMVNENMMQKQAAIDKLESDFSTYDKNVRAAIQQKDSELTDITVALRRALRDGNEKVAQELRNAYYGVQNDKVELENAMAGLEMEIQSKRQEYALELEKSRKAAQDEAELIANTSDLFRTTGKPQTIGDMIYLQKNPKMGDTYAKLLKGSQETDTAQKDLNSMNDLINELLSKNTGSITGALRVGSMIPGSSAQLSVNQLNQLKALLALENRQKLKGSGAISDFEAKVLDRAASTLGSNLSDSDFRNELIKLQQMLQSRGAVGTSYNTQDPLGIGIQ